MKIPDDDLVEWVADLFWLDFTADEVDYILQKASDEYKAMKGEERCKFICDTLGSVMGGIRKEYGPDDKDVVEITGWLKGVKREVKNYFKNSKRNGLAKKNN